MNLFPNHILYVQEVLTHFIYIYRMCRQKVGLKSDKKILSSDLQL